MQSVGKVQKWHLMVAAFVVLSLMAAATIGLDVTNTLAGVTPTGEAHRPFHGWPSLLAGIPQAAVGLLLVHVRPRHLVGWLLLASGIGWMLDAVSWAWCIYSVYTHPVLPGASLSVWFSTLLGLVLIPLMAAIVIIFPKGSLPEEYWWKRLAMTQLGLSALWPFAVLTAPYDAINHFSGTSMFTNGWTPQSPSLPVPFGFWQVLAWAGRPVMYSTLLVPLLVIAHQYRHADRLGRAQIRWLMWGVLLATSVPLATIQFDGFLVEVGLTISFGLLAIPVAMAISRHRLYDIDRLLPATIVYAAMAGLFLIIDALLIAIAGSRLDERDSTIMGTAFVAAGYALGRDQVWRWARRLLLGGQADAGTVAVLARSLETATDVEEQLQQLIRTLASAFRLQYASVQIERIDGTVSTFHHGIPRAPLLTLPITYRAEPVGLLTLNRIDRAGLHPAGQHLLGDLVRQAAAAVRATDINAALQNARTHLVLGREEERRRLRRDLHDGLGPSLGAISLHIDAARHTPEIADDMLEQATQVISTLLDDIRRLVYDLRPPALDELGLIDAVCQQSQRLAGPALNVSIRAERVPATLPAAVEVAAYRIISEAVTNVARHARARNCRIEIDGAPAGDELEIAVSDDGCGIAPQPQMGVGLISMRERAAELGGTAIITSVESGGTAVRCRLPLSTPVATVVDLRTPDGATHG